MVPIVRFHLRRGIQAAPKSIFEPRVPLRNDGSLLTFLEGRAHEHSPRFFAFLSRKGCSCPARNSEQCCYRCSCTVGSTELKRRRKNIEERKKERTKRRKKVRILKIHHIHNVASEKLADNGKRSVKIWERNRKQREQYIPRATRANLEKALMLFVTSVTMGKDRSA